MSEHQLLKQDFQLPIIWCGIVCTAWKSLRHVVKFAQSVQLIWENHSECSSINFICKLCMHRVIETWSGSLAAGQWEGVSILGLKCNWLLLWLHNSSSCCNYLIPAAARCTHSHCPYHNQGHQQKIHGSMQLLSTTPLWHPKKGILTNPISMIRYQLQGVFSNLRKLANICMPPQFIGASHIYGSTWGCAYILFKCTY
jgi:hypothetical protein